MSVGLLCLLFFFFFQAEDGIRDLVRSRGLGDVYKRQIPLFLGSCGGDKWPCINGSGAVITEMRTESGFTGCLLYTSDAADERSSVDLGGRRIIKKKKQLSLSSARLCLAK